jgi:hypothetical protein
MMPAREAAETSGTSFFGLWPLLQPRDLTR